MTIQQRQFTLTPGNPTLQVGLGWRAEVVYISNPTGSPIYIRKGSPMLPDVNTAHEVMPAMTKGAIVVGHQEFGISFADPQLLSGVNISSNLGTVATIVFYSDMDAVPSFGGASFQSLSLSEQAPLTNYVNGTNQVVDVSAWGGAIVHVSPDTNSGQGILIIQISSTGAVGTFRVFQQLAFWRGLPLTVMVPRVARFVRFFFSSTAIAGEPAMTGQYSIRTTIAEIARFDYQVTGVSLSNAYNVPNLSESSWVLVTYGLPSITIALRNTAGTGFYGQVIVETGGTAAGPWAYVATREQNISPGSSNSSMYRTLGTLGPYTRVRLLNGGVAGAIQGTIEFSIQPVQDLAGVLNDIYKALGDVSQPVSVRQSLYDLLSRIETNTVDLENWLSLIEVDTTAINTAVTAINARQTQSGVVLALQYTSGGAGVFTSQGIPIGSNFWINSIQASVVVPNGPLNKPGSVDIAYGTAGAPISTIYSFLFDQFAAMGPTMTFRSTDQRGALVPNGINTIWTRCSNSNARINVNLGYQV